MKTIKDYPTKLEADVARIALDGAGIPSVVVGVGAGMEGGIAGVQLLVRKDLFDQAKKVLKDS
jgi:Putative prokaryotic signal transducing protein